MKKALIDPRITAKFFSEEEVEIQIENSQRVCQVENQEFQVASPLYWLDCNDDVVADRFYYDFIENNFKEIINK